MPNNVTVTRTLSEEVDFLRAENAKLRAEVKRQKELHDSFLSKIDQLRFKRITGTAILKLLADAS